MNAWQQAGIAAHQNLNRSCYSRSQRRWRWHNI